MKPHTLVNAPVSARRWEQGSHAKARRPHGDQGRLGALPSAQFFCKPKTAPKNEIY